MHGNFLKIVLRRAFVLQRNRLEAALYQRPEEVLVFDYLMRQGSTPVIENDVIKYVAREMTEEEKHKK